MKLVSSDSRQPNSSVIMRRTSSLICLPVRLCDWSLLLLLSPEPSTDTLSVSEGGGLNSDGLVASIWKNVMQNCCSLRATGSRSASTFSSRVSSFRRSSESMPVGQRSRFTPIMPYWMAGCFDDEDEDADLLPDSVDVFRSSRRTWARAVSKNWRMSRS